MTDVSSLSTEQLLAIVNGAGQGASSAPPVDVSKMSNEDLLAIVNGGAGKSFDATRFDPVHAEGGSGALAPAMSGAAAKRKDELSMSAPAAAAVGAFKWGPGMGTWGDEIAGGIGAVASRVVPGYGQGDKPIGEAYDHFRDKFRRLDDQAWEDHPVAYGAGAVTGGVGTAAALPTLRVAQGAGKGAALINAAATGGAYGAVAGAGEGDTLGERTKHGVIGGVAGTVLGAGTHAVVDGVTGAIAARRAGNAGQEAVERALAPTSDEFALGFDRAQKTGNNQDWITRENMLKGMGYPDEARDAALAAKTAQVGPGGKVEQAVDKVGTELAGDAPVVHNPVEASRELLGSVQRTAADHASQADAAERGLATAAQRGGEDIRLRTGKGQDLVPQTGSDFVAGDVARQAINDRAQAAREAFKDAYGDVAQVPGRFEPGAFQQVQQSVKQRLAALDEPVLISDKVTPAAAGAMEGLGEAPGRLGPRPSLGDTEMERKRLVAWYKGASTPEDKRAVGAIMNAYDAHREDAVRAGLFGEPRPPTPTVLDAAPQPPKSPPAPGGEPAAPPAIEQTVKAEPKPRGPAPISLTRFIAMNGGLELTPDIIHADLHRVNVPFVGKLAKENGRSVDGYWRPKLMEEGYLPPEPDGYFSRDIREELFDALRREQMGDKTYRLQDQERVAKLAEPKIAAENAHYQDQLDRAARDITQQHIEVGISPDELHPGTLQHAADMLVSGREADPLTAYERAAMMRELPEHTAQVADVYGREASDALHGRTAQPNGGAPGLEGGPGAGSGPAQGPYGEGELFPVPRSRAPEASEDSGVEALSKLRKARALFADYQKTYKPQGSGDDVGAAMRKIVERDATPNEIAEMLYGGTQTGRRGTSVRLAQRVRSVVGEDDPAWHSVRQGLWNRLIGPEGELNGKSAQQVASRVQDFTDGRGQSLAQTMFGPAELNGMRQYANDLRAYAQHRTATPEGMQTMLDIASKNYSPEALAGMLVGSARPGSSIGNWRLVDAIEHVYGKDSKEWGLARQAIWRQLADVTDGKTPMGPEKLAQRISEFVNGYGSSVAERLFTEAERGKMQRLAADLRRLVPPPDVPNRSNTAGVMSKAANAAQKHAADLTGMIFGFTVGGGTGALAGKAAGSAAQKVLDRARVRETSRMFSGEITPRSDAGLRSIQSAVRGVGAVADPVTRAIPAHIVQQGARADAVEP